MALMSLRSPSHIKASMVLTIGEHLCIPNHIRYLLTIILIPILIILTRLEPESWLLCV